MNLAHRCAPAWLLLTALALLLGGCSPEAKKSKTKERADRQYAAGQYNSAEIEYLNLLKLDPQSGHAVGRLGLIYTAQGRTSRAVAYLMKGHEMLPNDLDLRLKVGQLYFATGKLSEARAEANFILDRNPQDPEAPSLFVATMTDPKEAETLRRRLLELPVPAPRGAPVLTALASLELRLGRIAEAKSLLSQAETTDPTFAPAYSVLAAIHLSQKNIADADKAFKRSADLSPPRSPRRMQYAQFKMRTGDASEGIKLLREITAKTPDYLPAWVALAEAHMRQNKLNDAETFLDRALSSDPQSLEARILRGQLYNLRSEFDKALALFGKLADEYPRTPIIHQELGRAYASIGDINKAVASLNQALVLAPNSTEAGMLLARLNGRKGDHNSAIALLRKITEQRPDLPEARLILADEYRAQGSLDAALAIYQQLRQQNPDHTQFHLLAGLVLAQQGKNSEAGEAFEQAFRSAPDSPVALEQIVNLGLREKRYDQMTARVETEVSKNTKLAGFGELLLAKIFLAKDDRSQAEGHLKKSIELMPDSPTAYFLLAGIYARSNRQDEALVQLKDVLERNPKQVTALMLLSVLQDQRGDHAAARDGYEKLLAINPRSVVALNNLAYLYSEKFNNLNKAHELAQKARQMAPGDPHNADTLGWILYRKREYPWALSLLQEAADKLPEEAEIHFHLGLTYYMLGDEVPARTALQRALEQAPAATWTSDARQALSILDINPSDIGSSAKPTLDKALADRPDDPVALFRMAALQEREGKTELAISSLEAALKASTHNVKLMLKLAQLHGAAKNSVKAIEYAKAARKLAPDDPDVAQSLGRLAYQNGDYPWAVSLLQEAVRRQQNSPNLLFDFALASYSVGRTAETEKALRDALALAAKQTLTPFAPTDEARQMLELIGLADNPSEATRQASVIDRALKQNPASVPALMAAATLNEQRHEYEVAREGYTKVLTMFPDFVPAKKRLVVLGASLKEFDQRTYDLALQVRTAYPTDSSVARILGIQSYLKGDYSRSVSLLKESTAAQSNDADGFYYYGLAQRRQNDPAFTVSLRRALELGLKDQKMADEARKLLSETK